MFVFKICRDKESYKWENALIIYTISAYALMIFTCLLVFLLLLNIFCSIWTKQGRS